MFEIRKRNGDVRLAIPLPNLLSKHTSMIREKILLPGWSYSVRQIAATARHVSARGLKSLVAPVSLKRALASTNVDRLIWIAS